MSFIIGLDLGQSQDYTAITVVERVRVGEAPQAPIARYGAVGGALRLERNGWR